eukprot:g9245.t1
MAHRMLAPREAATDDEDEFQQADTSEVDSLASVNSRVSELATDINKDSVNLSGHALDFEESPLVSEDDDEREPNLQKTPVETHSIIEESEVLDGTVQQLQTAHELSSGASGDAVEANKDKNEVEKDSEDEQKAKKKTAEGVLEVKRKSQKPFDIPTTGDFYMHDDRFTSTNIPTTTTIRRQKPSQVSSGVGINASRWKHDKFEEMEKEHEQRSTQKEDREIPTLDGRWLKNKLPSRGRGRRGSRFQASASGRGRGRGTGAPSRGYRGGGRTYSGRFGTKFSQHPSTQSNSYSTASFNDGGWSF